MDLYRQNLLEHYKSPSNRGKLDTFSHRAHANNPLCGDEIDVYLQVSENQIVELSFESESCMVTIATASLVTDQLKGQSVDEAKKMTIEHVTELLGTPLTSSRQECAKVVLTAIQKALE